MITCREARDLAQGPAELIALESAIRGAAKKGEVGVAFKPPVRSDENRKLLLSLGFEVSTIDSHSWVWWG